MPVQLMASALVPKTRLSPAPARRLRRLPVALLASVVALTGCLVPPAASAAGRAPWRPSPASRALVAALPLSFEPNRGQAARGVAFLAHGPGYSVALGPKGAALTMQAFPSRPPAAPVVVLTLVGANPAARGQAEQQLPGTVAYLSRGRTRPGLAAIPTYGAVRYAGVYPGVDLIYHGKQGRLEYDVVVAPGADPRRIRLAFGPAGQLALGPEGDLLVRTAGGVVRHRAPVVYQVARGVRRPVRGAYVLAGRVVTFQLGAYDRHLPLVIDPVVVYSTYFGGPGDDYGTGIAVDGQGNMYVVGTTTSAAKTSVAFVTKLDPTGRHVLYTKYVGNIYGTSKTACKTTGTGIAVDGQGNAYITGQYGDADEFDLCTTELVLWARIDPSGHALVRTFGKYGGSKGAAIAVDRRGASYITGSTDQWEANFPVTPGAFQPKPGIDREQEGVAGDAFVLKVDAAGRVVYGTFLGGSGIDSGLGIAVDGQGEAYVVGTSGVYLITGALDFPITTSAFQRRPGNPYAAGFLSVLSADGSRLLYSTYLSGDNGEDVAGIAVDRQGNAYVTGSTDSRTFPTTPTAYKRTCGTDGLCNPQKTWYTDHSTNTNYWRIAVTEDVFVAVIDPRRSGAASLLYSTFIGGMNRDLGTAIAVDSAGRAYVTGRTASRDYPGAQASTAGSWDALLTVIDPRRSGPSSLVFSAAFGGSGYDEGDGIALDARGAIYLTGYTGSARSFPTRNALQPTGAGRYDAFITRVSPLGARP